jgi:hypothetical protein
MMSCCPNRRSQPTSLTAGADIPSATAALAPGADPPLFLCGPRAITGSVGRARRCASGPHAEASPLAFFCFSKFSDLVQIIANFKTLHKIHLTSENYETNFVG